MIHKLILVCLLFFSFPKVIAQNLSSLGKKTKPRRKIQCYHYPSLKTGTHFNEIGYLFNPNWIGSISDQSDLKIGLESLIKYNFTNIGIPEPSFSWVNRLGFVYSYGKSRPYLNNNYVPNNLRKNNLAFYYMHYASTDQTHQFSGAIQYTRALDKKILKLGVENDFFAFFNRDEYRTSALFIDYLWFSNDKLLGVGLENILWTGTTGDFHLNRGDTYDMSKQFGGEYSHGILALRLHYQNITFKIGYDADKIRTRVQHTVHDWINDGRIPRGSKSHDRFYFNITMNMADWLY